MKQRANQELQAPCSIESARRPWGAVGAAAVFSVFSAAAGGQREPLRFEAGWNHGVALAGGKQEGADVPEPDSGGVRSQVGAQHSGEFRIGFAMDCERGQDSLYFHAVESHSEPDAELARMLGYR